MSIDLGSRDTLSMDGVSAAALCMGNRSAALNQVPLPILPHATATGAGSGGGSGQGLSSKKEPRRWQTSGAKLVCADVVDSDDEPAAECGWKKEPPPFTRVARREGC